MKTNVLVAVFGKVKKETIEKEIAKQEWAKKSYKIKIYPGKTVKQLKKVVVDAKKLEVEYVWFVDSKLELPQKAVFQLMLAREPVVSAVYRDKNNHWNAYFVDDNRVVQRIGRMPMDATFHVGIIDLGCTLVKRVVLECAKFDATNELKPEWNLSLSLSNLLKPVPTAVKSGLICTLK